MSVLGEVYKKHTIFNSIEYLNYLNSEDIDMNSIELLEHVILKDFF